MGHIIQFIHVGRKILDDREVVDLIDFFYRWNDTRFEVVWERDDASNRHRRGCHIYEHQRRTHVIKLNAQCIIRACNSGQRLGGNGTAPGGSPRAGAGMVVTHELQHANQAGQHLATEKFYTHRDYNTRPCEREARAFVDSNLRQVLTLVAPELLRVQPAGGVVCADLDGVEEVVEVLGELSEVTTADIRTELRLSGINNPINLGRVIHMLTERGVKIS